MDAPGAGQFAGVYSLQGVTATAQDFQCNADSSTEYQHRLNTGNLDGPSIMTPVADHSGTPRIFGTNFDFSGSGTYYQSVDGVDSTTPTTYLTKITTTGTFRTMANRFELPIPGKQSESIIYTDKSDKQEVEAYIAWKYGLVANLDAGHPYKSITPKRA
jgi:hypothetical protein